ncbi:murein L,D-transpeptidase catalytic domain family protein [Hufsiella ginkgonis]|uniref:Murein L,D-transpeptidase catalytic domain family protein n=1 Tax=Hufsiella ginkgonis TaxID=2695274 RepID=A0A7K1XTU0_9SPHI|nr:murein L,D-transpeptidase catalytic domain family protein [Hufsiella ginkgonis]MXV14433.1 hypothetical protein [Hufsiella ginkgonis]
MRKHSFIVSGIAAVMMAGSVLLSWTPDTQLTSKVTGTDSAAVTTGSSSGKALFEEYVTSIYESAGLSGTKLDFDTFRKAVTGYLNLKQGNLVSKPLLTIVDFTRSSREKRLWIVNLDDKKLLFNSLVAHGQGSGDDMAQSFSNVAETHQSSLGFYVTDDTYIGKHGLSLRLNGVDNGYNSNARDRAIVLHGAEYVSEQFIAQHGRLGRSYGCPAIPVDLTNKIIGVVKGKSVIFINGQDLRYNSAFLDQDKALSSFNQPTVATLQAKI